MRPQLLAAAAILLPAASLAADDQPKVEPQAAQPLPFAAGPSRHELKVIDPVPANCPTLASEAARKRGKSLAPDKLAELPPGEAFHAVYRVGPDGCPDPVMVGYQYMQDR